MKTNHLLLLLLILFVSCQQTELQFSCDPEIDQFVIENRDELSKIDVFEITSYDLALQKAIFNSWDYQKKRSAWIDKFTYVLTHGNFADDEISHVQKLIDHIQPEYFLDQNSLSGSHDQFANEWINYSFSELNWSEEFVAFMVFRLYTDFSQFESELSQLNQLKETIVIDSEDGDCLCSVSLDLCGLYFNCTSGTCNEVSSGCGWLWNQPCDGMCN